MKYVKMLGLAVITAAAVMGFAGASTASATDILCETNTSPCSSPVVINGTIKAEANDPKLTGDVELTCTSSTVTLKVTNNDGNVTPSGEVTALTWSGCKDLTHFGIGCTVTTQNLPYSAEVVTPGPNLTVKPHSGGGSPGAKVVCGGFISCTFQRTDFTLPIDVGSPASVTANAVELEKAAGGGLCPEESFWDAKYVAESPTSSLFVTAATVQQWRANTQYAAGEQVEHPAGSKTCYEAQGTNNNQTPPSNPPWSPIDCP